MRCRARTELEDSPASGWPSSCSGPLWDLLRQSILPPLICDLRVLAVSRTPAHDSPEMSCVHGVVARLNGVRKPPLLLSIHASL